MYRLSGFIILLATLLVGIQSRKCSIDYCKEELSKCNRSVEKDACLARGRYFVSYKTKPISASLRTTCCKWKDGELKKRWFYCIERIQVGNMDCVDGHPKHFNYTIKTWKGCRKFACNMSAKYD